jgi:hypothetical protein
MVSDTQPSVRGVRWQHFKGRLTMSEKQHPQIVINLQKQILTLIVERAKDFPESLYASWIARVVDPEMCLEYAHLPSSTLCDLLTQIEAVLHERNREDGVSTGGSADEDHPAIDTTCADD